MAIGMVEAIYKLKCFIYLFFFFADLKKGKG